MKNLMIKSIGLLVLLITSFYPASKSGSLNSLNMNNTYEISIESSELLIEKMVVDYQFVYKVYVNQIGKRESGRFKYKACNPYGFHGKYQFGRAALTDCGIRVTWKEFHQDTALQELAMYRYLKINRNRLSGYIKKYSGKHIRGVYITESGILAGAHFGGATGVKRYLRSWGRINRADANKTRISHYVRDFGSYDIDWDQIHSL